MKTARDIFIDLHENPLKQFQPTNRLAILFLFVVLFLETNRLRLVSTTLAASMATSATMASSVVTTASLVQRQVPLALTEVQVGKLKEQQLLKLDLNKRPP